MKLIRSLIPPSLRYQLSEKVSYLKEVLSRAAIWKWEILKINPSLERSNSFLYIGRRNRRDMAMLLLGIKHQADISNKNETSSEKRVLVTEMPLPGAICMPQYLSTILALDRPIDELLARMNKDKLRFYRKNRESYRFRQLLDDEEIDHADNTILRPYAENRYGEGVAHLEKSDIKKMAKDTGALNLVYFNDEEVACFIGSEFSRDGKHYWRGTRSGYPAQIFSDNKRFGETNNMTTFLEIEWIIQNGFDYYDIGISLARPNDGVIQWKRAYRGNLDLMGNYNYFYICPPKANTCEFFWETPIFGLENGKLTLHLGKPEIKSDEDFIKHIRQMGFGGLSTVYLHCEQPPLDNILTALNSIYSHLECPPSIKIVQHAK